jgi:LPS sulfotransferase NodH
MDARLDFPRAVPMRRSYIVASSFRCGSTFLCSRLWKTGVLGAPAEYLNVGAGRLWRDVMMRRLDAGSPDEYLLKLLSCRTSRNGVFGMKIHFPHFEAALKWYPSILTVLSPVTYIYITRRDKMAQAVSMARAVQTNAWSSLDDKQRAQLVYDEAFIVQCLREIQEQDFGWLRWFEKKNISPFIVRYEELVADTANAVRGVVELLGAQNDEPDEVWLPLIEKQGDEVNLEWIRRFRRERDRGMELDGGHQGIAGWQS